MSTIPLTGRALLVAALLSLAACADADGPGVTVEGVDPATTDGDLTPDTGLRPGDPGLAPEADGTPQPGLAPDATLQPDSLETP